MSGAIVHQLKAAAEIAAVSVDTLKRAIKATDPNSYPPPLKAKRQGRARNAPLVVLDDDLRAWISAWPDA